jgi:hypothetical protein
MKYSIQETNEKVAPYKLFRYDEYAGVPNNAELEFWMKIQELETAGNTLSQRLWQWMEWHANSCGGPWIEDNEAIKNWKSLTDQTIRAAS